MRCRPPRRWVTTASRRRRRAGSTPSSGPTGHLRSGRSGSPSGTRPATPTSATPSRPTTLVRRPTAVDAVAERYLDAFASLDPCAATEMGIVGHDDDITDYSPDGVAARVDAARSALRELDGTPATDNVDHVTVAAMRERLGLQIALHDAHLDVGDLNVIASPLQSMRDVFDLMATETHEDWALIGRRMSKVPDRVSGYIEALHAAVAAGRAPAARQIARGIEQAGQIQQLFVEMVADVVPENAVLHAELQRRASAAADAYGTLTAALRDEIAPYARHRDAFGRDAYGLLSREFLGTAVDFGETYQWGLEQLESIVAEQESIAHRLYPGMSVGETLSRLDDEPRYLVHGTDALQEWMQDLSDRAVESLAGKRSEERRVGKECRSRWSRYQYKEKRADRGARNRE